MLEKLRGRFRDGAATRTDGGHSAGSDLSRTETETSGSATDGSGASDPTTAGPGAETPEGDVDIGLDEIFGMLKNRRRRAVLRYLTTGGEQVRIGELAEEIAARECDKSVPQVTSTERKRVYVALYQCHLPKLSDVGAISYNQPRGTIAPGSNFDIFGHHLPAEEGAVEAARSGRGWTRSLSGLLTR
jgi:hypothetical protein